MVAAKELSHSEGLLIGNPGLSPDQRSSSLTSLAILICLPLESVHTYAKKDKKHYFY